MTRFTGGMMVLLAAVAVVAIHPRPSHSTEPFAKVRTSALLFSPYTLSRSVRNQAMGGAGVSDPADHSNALYNPANLVGAHRVSSHYSQYEYADLITYRDAGVSGSRSFARGRVEVAAGVRYVYEDYKPLGMDFLPPGTGQPFDPDGGLVTGTVAAAYVRGSARYAAGVSLGYLRTEFYDETLDAHGFDVGLRADWRFATVNFRAGASALNVGGDVDSDFYFAELPSRFRAGLGAGYAAGHATVPFGRRSVPRVCVALDVDYVHEDFEDRDDAVVAGTELGLFDTLFLRAGASGRLTGQDSGGTFGAGIALGYASFRLRLDMATYPNPSPIADGRDTVLGLTLDYLP